jgi:CheY-like chemotaxis protein
MILLVEDEPMVQMNIEDALVDGGFAVLLASNGAEALAVLDQTDQTIAGVVTDIRLGAGPSGWEVARRARETRPEIPMVYITGDSAHEWSAWGVPNSVLVQKPFAVAQLTTAIATLLNDVDRSAL